MLSKLDVVGVKNPNFVELGSSLSVFNLQGLPVPWNTTASSTNSTSARRRLTASDMVGGNSTTVTAYGCYSSNDAVHNTRNVQKLVNIKNVASKFAHFESNLFYVLLALSIAVVAQVLFFLILRAVVRSRVQEYRRKLARLSNFAKSIKNANRMKFGQTTAETEDEVVQNVTASGASAKKQQSACQRAVCRGAIKSMESLFGLVLLKRKETARDAMRVKTLQRRPSTRTLGARPPEVRDVIGKFIIKEEQSVNSMTVKGSAHIYVVLLLTVYQGVCESCAFVLAVDAQGAQDFSTGEYAASLITFVVIVIAGFLLVWIILLAFVRPQQLVLYKLLQSKWVGTDAHGVLLQHSGALFRSYRHGGGRYLFTGVWMLNLMCLAFVLAFATGELQIYLMLANEAWIACLYFAWQPFPQKKPVFGGCGHINKNILLGMERILMMCVLSIAAFYPVDPCSELPEWVNIVMISIAVVPAVVPLIFMLGDLCVWINKKCAERQARREGQQQLAKSKRLRHKNQIMPLTPLVTSKRPPVSSSTSTGPPSAAVTPGNLRVQLSAGTSPVASSRGLNPNWNAARSTLWAAASIKARMALPAASSRPGSEQLECIEHESHDVGIEVLGSHVEPKRSAKHSKRKSKRKKRSRKPRAQKNDNATVPWDGGSQTLQLGQQYSADI